MRLKAPYLCAGLLSSVIQIAVLHHPAFGQEALSDRPDTVIVTAQRREQPLNEVPISITTLDGDALAESGIENVSQITGLAPNIHIDNTSPFAGSGSILSAYIRGIGQNDFAFNLEPGVGLYVDGVYHARAVGAVVDLLDVERVEVLRGPQGTLFGRNTIGGAISVVTRKPTGNRRAGIDITFGSFDRSALRGFAEFPFSDNFAAQLAFGIRRREGFQRRIDFPGAGSAISDRGQFFTAGDADGERRQGGESAETIRFSARYSPIGPWEFNFSVDGTHSRDQATPATLLDTYETNPLNGRPTFVATYNACINLPVAVISMTPPLDALCSPRATVGTALGGVNVDADTTNNRLPYGDHFITSDIDTSYARGSNFSNVDTFGATLTVDHRISETISLKSIAAYRALDSSFGAENGGAPIVVTDTSFRMNQEQYSGELQANATLLDGRLNSVAGVIVFHEQGELHDFVQLAEGLIQVVSPNNFQNDSIGLFSHNSFRVSDSLSLTIGARYSRETKQFTGGQLELNEFGIRTGVPPFLYPDPSNLQRLYPLGDNRLSFDNVALKAGVEYRFTDELMAYVSYADGYKSGGWQARLVLPAAAVYGSPEAPTFSPEKANAYEIGWRSTFFDRRLRLNATAFWTDYSNMFLS